MSSALLRGKTADAPKPGSKALAHGTGVIQEPWRNFIIIHTFIYTYNIDIHKYIYIHESSSSYATCEGRYVFTRLVTGDLGCL